jgi:tartrate/fumarate subfamily iron-sulfur-dependent hydro-lyase beta chain
VVDPVNREAHSLDPVIEVVALVVDDDEGWKILDLDPPDGFHAEFGEFQAAGGSLIMLAKGNRSKAVKDACRQFGGFYLGSVGGPAARLAQDCIRKVEVLEFPELGMEAVWRIEVENFPAFIVIDDKGNDFYDGIE